jgi:hypothetical protein
MKISYDSEIDALNIGRGEKLVGIEIVDAREVLGAGKLPSLTVENVVLTDAKTAASVAREKPARRYGSRAGKRSSTRSAPVADHLATFGGKP